MKNYDCEGGSLRWLIPTDEPKTPGESLVPTSVSLPQDSCIKGINVRCAHFLVGCINTLVDSFIRGLCFFRDRVLLYSLGWSQHSASKLWDYRLVLPCQGWRDRWEQKGGMWDPNRGWECDRKRACDTIYIRLLPNFVASDVSYLLIFQLQFYLARRS